MSDTLKCETCNRHKGVHLFYRRKQTKRGYSKSCKSCVKKSPQYRRTLGKAYMRKFGISLDEYERILDYQGGRCYICRKKPANRRLAVDHDHSLEHLGMANSVRGLLCRNCNEYLGHIQDNPESGLRINDYLTRQPWRSR